MLMGPEVWFAPDSPLEEGGFEPSVPPRENPFERQRCLVGDFHPTGPVFCPCLVASPPAGKGFELSVASALAEQPGEVVATKFGAAAAWFSSISSVRRAIPWSQWPMWVGRVAVCRAAAQRAAPRPSGDRTQTCHSPSCR